MNALATAIFSATLSQKRDKILLRGKKDDRASEFFQTLPAGRWDAFGLCWSVEATPSCAWRILNDSPVAIEADEPILALSTLFADSLEEPGGSQPPLRLLDSWSHQIRAYHFSNSKTGALLAMGMGTGKTKVAVDLVVNRGAMRTIVLCPVSVRGVWRREFEKHAASPVEVLVLDKGTVAQKTRKADAFLERCRIERKAAAVVINYESAWRGDFASWSLGISWDVAILDESHRAKTHDTAVSKYAASLGKTSAFRLCLTGTPMGQGPLDLFGQFRFLDRGIFGTWFHHFRNRYAKLNPIFPGKVDSWINQEELKRRFALLAYRVTAEEVLDLPPVMHHERLVELGPEGRKVYTSLEDDLIADLGTGVVTATNALTRLLRLQQVTSGYVVEDETKREVEVDDGKRLALLELLEDMGPGEPVVVFCRFRHDLQTVAGAASSLGRRYGELSGRLKDGLTERGEMEDGVQVMGVQIQAGGLGVDLTRARYCVFLSLGFNLTEYEQALARVHRPGQLLPVHYYHLLAEGTVDRAVYGALRKKQDVIGEVLEGLKR